MNIKKLKNIAKVLVVVVALSAPMVMFAAPELGLSAVKSGTNLTDFGVTGGGRSAIQNLIINIIKTLLAITAAIAVLFIIIGGYQFITSAANPNGAKQGKETLKNAVIGLIIIMLSYAIVVAVTSFLGDPLSGGGSTPPVAPPTQPPGRP